MGNSITAVNFLTADVTFIPKKKKILRHWINQIAKNHQCLVEQIDFIYCSDSYLLTLNQEYLNHNTFTDIITFDYGNSKTNTLKSISGEIYISIERVKENAKIFSTSYTNELHRVMIHGVLHLCGFKDKKEKEKEQMRMQEDAAIRILNQLR